MGREFSDCSVAGKAGRLVEEVLRTEREVFAAGGLWEKCRRMMLIMRWPEVRGGGVSWSYWILWGRIMWGLSDRFPQPSYEKNVVPELCSLWSI